MSDNFRIDISRDKMTATVRVLGHEPPEGEEIIAKLKSAGINFGLISDVFTQCICLKPGEPLVIAQGQPPVPGVNGWVEFIWENDDESEEVEDEETIDYRETSKLCSVNEGDLLAVRHPATKGQPGRAVTGEVVFPPEPKEAVINFGKGVKLSSDENKAFSTIQGMPVGKRSGVVALVKVDHSYTVNGDVSMKTGNIRFKGDVVVTGNVTETMVVEASGNVKVSGIITGAHVMCGESLVVNRNIISSEITAGMGYVECGKIKYIIEDLVNDFNKLTMLLEQMKDKLEVADKLSFAQIIHGVIDNRYKNIKVNIKHLLSTITFNLPFEVVDAIEAVKIITGVSFNHKDLMKMIDDLNNALNIMEIQDVSTSIVTANSVNGATINCSGKVSVIGTGCVNSNIFAGGNVRIVGPFKGGQIVSEGNVEIDELGSSLGSPVLVRVKSKNFIKVKKTNPGCVIQIGSTRINIAKELSAAKFVIGSDAETIDIV
ncbi:MAG: DUF342 domain-containing protein [Peptococcaceae bacterium]|nr:DUF342 domain-containing protein [Peptococcaceae bacterium]